MKRSIVPIPELFFATVNDPENGLNQVANGDLAGLLADGMQLEHLLSSNQWLNIEIPIVTSTPIHYLMPSVNTLIKE